MGQQGRICMGVYAMKELAELREDRVLQLLSGLVREKSVDAYLVGGMVRNAVLSSPKGFDYDVVLSDKIELISKDFSRCLEGSVFLLDKVTGSYRVIKRQNGGLLSIDISPYKGGDIIEDLNARDFTINAMAVSIKELFEKSPPELFDPLNGMMDCKKKILKPVSKGVFDDDPLRCLRAVRLSAQYNLAVSGAVCELIKIKANLLNKIAAERIRDEFFAILLCRYSYRYVLLLYELGILPIILPETDGWSDKIIDKAFPCTERLPARAKESQRGCSLLEHSLETLKAVELLFAMLKDTFPDLCNVIEEHFSVGVGGISRKGLFLFAAFIHDAGKPDSMEIYDDRIRFFGHDLLGDGIARRMGNRLRLSKRAISILKIIVRNHHRVFNLVSLDKQSFRSKTRFFRSAGGEEGVDLLLLAICDARATRGDADPELMVLIKEMLKFYYNVYLRQEQEPLLRGSDVMRLFGLKEGILIGRILDEIAKAEEKGIVHNKEEAVKFIAGWLLSLSSKDRQ
jgi:tRNA nucleotidyltransferase/poly(A) polymerase